MSKIQIHFDGHIAKNHQVTIRTLGKTLQHLQSALDRAYIEQKHGHIWKHARMLSEDFTKSDFLVEAPREGGYILSFFSDNPVSKWIVDRVSSALTPAFEQAKQKGLENTQSIQDQLKQKSDQVSSGLVTIS
ncbi:hypothetical protein O5O45_08515 [Hahella aquimaris]|uniref:hypothetical protein n=1 Tax=Hahella sp. HNIBRBA332 TaxID=3015983 RepID=UPI00273C7D4F|nr:hypothetical protein [Hahella sp. HNIBRBA332]WLQ15955.1 hypothetical protein O5O45_08515 [Hahella sp. HNIBRBA332]